MHCIKNISAIKQLPYNPVIGWKPITKVILIPEKFKYLNLRPHSSSRKERSKKQNVTVNKPVA